MAEQAEALPAGGIPAMMGRMDPTVQELVDADVPMTQQNYLDARFDGDVPEAWQQESQMGLPPELQGFSGVGTSELPQGPLPIPEGRMGVSPQQLAQAPTTKLGQAQQAPQVAQPHGGASSPLRQTGPSGQGQFKQSVGFKPQNPLQGGQGG